MSSCFNGNRVMRGQFCVCFAAYISILSNGLNLPVYSLTQGDYMVLLSSLGAVFCLLHFPAGGTLVIYSLLSYIESG